jgi:hypothetical protein
VFVALIAIRGSTWSSGFMLLATGPAGGSIGPAAAPAATNTTQARERLKDSRHIFLLLPTGTSPAALQCDTGAQRG